MKKRTSYFSLIEIIIATSLFAILIFSTTSLFFRYHKLSARIDSIRPKVFERALFYGKMSEMSDSIDIHSISEESYDHTEFLSFTFDNGFKDDATLSGKCTCSIYRTMDGNVMYTVSNDKGKESTRSILTQIHSFSSKIHENLLIMTLSNTDTGTITYTFTLPEKASGAKK